MGKKKPNTKGQILYASNYSRYLEQAHARRQKVEWERKGLGRLFNGHRVSVWDVKKDVEIMMGAQRCDILSAVKFYI